MLLLLQIILLSLVTYLTQYLLKTDVGSCIYVLYCVPNSQESLILIKQHVDKVIYYYYYDDDDDDDDDDNGDDDDDKLTFHLS